MKNLENIPEGLFDLLNEKDFGQLNEEELSMVLEYMTSEEYDESHQMLKEFSSEDSKLQFQALPPIVDIEEAQPRAVYKKAWLVPIAATLALIFSLGFLIIKMYDEPQDEKIVDLPIVKEELFLPDPSPELVEVEQVSVQQVQRQVEIIKEVTEKSGLVEGQSLASENYPSQLIIRI